MMTEVDHHMEQLPTLPPGWEAVESQDNHRIYYWNKKTGATTWKFPQQEAQQHQSKVRRHTYENIKKPSTPVKASIPPSLQPLLSREGSQPSSPGSPRVAATLQSGPAARRAIISKELAQPSSPGASSRVGISMPLSAPATARRPYENVILSDTQPPSSPASHVAAVAPQNVVFSDAEMSPPPQYEEIESVGQIRQSANPLYGKGSVSSAGSSLSEPLSPSPSLPSRKYSDTEVMSPGPDLPDRRYTPPPDAILEELRATSPGVSSLHQPPMHEMSATGTEYAVISHKHVQRKHQSKEGHEMPATGTEYAVISHKHVQRKHQSREGHVLGGGGAPQAEGVPPTLPLRARERMSRENLLAACSTEGVGVSSAESSVVSDQVTTQAPEQAYQWPPKEQVATVEQTYLQQPTIAYSIVKLDPVSGKLKVSEEEEEERLSLPKSPQPYEVASPTASASNLQQQPFALHTSPDPHYEEIQRPSETGAGNGRPRGFSSPVSVEHATGREGSPDYSTHSHTPSSQDEVTTTTYDLPSNSRKFQALNVTLRRTATPQTEYAKLSLSREALLLRSGVTLRRHDRESLSSLSSFASRLEGEDPGANSGPGTSDEEESSMEPISKCIKSLESSLMKSDSGDFKLVLPQQPSSPSWMNFKRRPHAYEEIMGASQEQLDWDESDLSGAPLDGGVISPRPNEGEEPEPCEMIKVDDLPSTPQEPRMRVVHHQYEDVVLGDEVKGDEEGAALPRGWQRMQGKQGKDYYWHIPTGRTQYSPPSATSPVKQSSDDGQSRPSPPSPVGQTFPARYLGWMPITENQLVTGQCVKAVHVCIGKMAKSLQQGGETKGEEVLLQVKGMELQLLKPGSLVPMATQFINRIRVWGIGLENERDFGYVSRDPATRKHRCHIFRCSLPARAVAHVLLEAHQRQRTRVERGVASSGTDVSATPTANGSVHRGGHERYERFQCVYVGSCSVGTGQGMEVLNEAVERLKLDQRQWQDVLVDVATSNVTISDKTGSVVKEHRIRYLCFLGIARDDKFCGYVLDSGDRKGEKCFRFYGFRMEPNTDRLCLALHAACQARYKRVQEAASRQQSSQGTGREVSHGRSGSDSRPTSSLLGKFGSLKKKKHSVVETKSFTVLYLGQQGVAKVDGLDTVRPVVQELAVNPKPNCPQEVEFDVSSAGLAIRDPQGKTSRREFPVKNITYVVKIRNYFAFVAREKSKYFCHAFMEAKVDTGAIVTTIQSMLTPPK